MRRHSTDPVALLAGALFITVGAAYLGGALGDRQIEARWVLPTVLIALGFAGLVVSLVNLAKQRRTAEVAAQPVGGGAPLAEQGADTTATTPLGTGQPETMRVETSPTAKVPAEKAEPAAAEPEMVEAATAEQEISEPPTESLPAEPPQTLSLLETSPVEADGEAGEEPRERS